MTQKLYEAGKKIYQILEINTINKKRVRGKILVVFQYKDNIDVLR